MLKLKTAVRLQQSEDIIKLTAKYNGNKQWEAYIKKLLTGNIRLKSVAIRKQNKVKSSYIYDLAKAAKLKHLHKIRTDMISIEDDPIRTVNYALLEKMFKRINKIGLLIKYQVFDRLHSYDEIKALSEYMKRAGPKADKDWKLFVDIEKLWGWRLQEGGDRIWTKVLNWVKKQFKPKYNNNEETFYIKFRQKIREIFNWKHEKTQQQYTAEEFVKIMPLAGTAGSAFEPKNKKKITIKSHGYDIKYTNNKFTKTAAIKEEIRLKELLNNTEHVCNVNTKIEIYPKERIIISQNYFGAEQMRYVNIWLTKHFKNNKLSTLWMSKSQAWEMWVEFSKNKGVNVPIDQSAFDHHVSKLMIQIVNEELEERIKRDTGQSDTYEVMKKITEQLKTGKVMYKYKDEIKTTNYENGVLSGWGFTAFYDTIINLAEMRLAEDRMLEEKIEFYTVQENVQGDDQNKAFTTWNASLAYWASMISMGLDINLEKNFFSSVHNEYLRKGSSDNETSGYGSRMINGMCWVYPGSTIEKNRQARLSATVDKWVKLGQRFKMEEATIINMILEDTKQAKFTTKEAETYIHAPKTLGGAGIGKTRWNEIQSMGGEWKTRIDILGDGFKEFKLRYGTDQSRELDNWMLSVSNIVETKEIDEMKEEVVTVVHTVKEIQPLEFIFSKVPKTKTTSRIEGWPDQVIFSDNDELMRKIFPNIDLFLKTINAPKSWAYEYLTGKLKIITPEVHNLSIEFSSMLWDAYKNSILMAMVKKRRTDDKWRRLSLYAEKNFSNFVQQHIKTDVRMVA